MLADELSTMHNTSIMENSAHLNPGASIESTIMHGLKQGSIGITMGNSPKLPNLPLMVSSRNVYVQKR